MTYTPSSDPILPTPAELHVKVKNTSAIPLRAAYLHGPYTLYTACYPADYDPNHKYERGELEAIPQFEPNLKAGGSWAASMPIPESFRLASLSAGNEAGSSSRRSMKWIIEITSQVIFSTTAAVHFELLVGRDQKSLSLSSNGASSLGGPAHIRDHQFNSPKLDGVSSLVATKGVFSKSVEVVVEDTKALWRTPPFPSVEEKERLKGEALQHAKDPGDSHPPGPETGPISSKETVDGPAERPKKRRIHFVVLTHGLHSNLGADMLYLKESIDAASRASREKSRQNREKNPTSRNPTPKDTSPSGATGSQAPTQGEVDDEDDDGEDDDAEEVIVRGFPGNAVRTERGLQYLGKRLAKYVLLMTYPDQPYLPTKQSKTKNVLARSIPGLKHPTEAPDESLANDLRHDLDQTGHRDYAYQITSISFIGHSLGGLIQTYAIAYIQKHSPEFFERIRPINFVALATPFLGLSNENPIYVRFALDLGLVGRTGQDLGLSWTAPRVRSGWGAMIGGTGGETQKPQLQPTAASKPLLRILPSGPAHQVLLKFRNRTVYSNVVNDGIVPLRTSCLLFLDWRGLDRVEKARRGNGLVGTMAEWGWAELTGANSTSIIGTKLGTDVPGIRDPATKAMDIGNDAPEEREDGGSDGPNSPALSSQSQFFNQSLQNEPGEIPTSQIEENTSSPGPFSHFWSIFNPKESKGSSGQKHAKIYKRSQTLSSSDDSSLASSPARPQRRVVRGDSLYEEENLTAPPKTTIFESAGDVLRPPLPPLEYILDPASRPRTIFHDRVYHPEDIPPPPVKRHTSVFVGPRSPFKSGSKSHSAHDKIPEPDRETSEISGSSMKVEEKIARAYHHDLSWRKVLVRLEPDAHNNIIVRRMFANAYGWPVVKHLVDTHFGHTFAARTKDAIEPSKERAKPLSMKATETGEEVVGQARSPNTFLPPDEDADSSRTLHHDDHGISVSNMNGTDVPAREIFGSPGRQSQSSGISKQDSAKWTDRYLSGDDSHTDSERD